MDTLCSPEMPRRAFIAVIAGGLLAAPLAAEAQPAGKVVRIGYLSLQREDGRDGDKSWVAAFRQRLRDLGYVEGRNVTIEQRHAAADDPGLLEIAGGPVLGRSERFHPRRYSM